MLCCKILGSPHPRAMVKSIDTSKAEKMPGVEYVLTSQNGPKPYPMPTDLDFQGEVVAIVAAETEDQAEDAVEALKVEYEVLPFASSLQQAMAPNPPDLSTQARGNVVRIGVSLGRRREGLSDNPTSSRSSPTFMQARSHSHFSRLAAWPSGTATS